MLQQVAPLADAAALPDVALMPRALIHPAEAGHARKTLPLWQRCVLVEHLVREADIAVAPGTLRIRVGKAYPFPKTPVRRMRRQDPLALGHPLGKGRGLLLLRQRRRGARGPLRLLAVGVPAGPRPLLGRPTPGALPRRCAFGC